MVFKFPRDKTQTSVKFRASIDDKIVETKVMEETKAKEKYDDTIAKGHGAAMMREKKDSSIH